MSAFSAVRQLVMQWEGHAGVKKSNRQFMKMFAGAGVTYDYCER